MERKQFLSLCRSVAELPPGIAGTLNSPPPELLVTYEGSVYYPVGLEIKFNRGDAVNVAVLHSLKTNSLIHAPLDKVSSSLRKEGAEKTNDFSKAR